MIFWEYLFSAHKQSIKTAAYIPKKLHYSFKPSVFLLSRVTITFKNI